LHHARNRQIEQRGKFAHGHDRRKRHLFIQHFWPALLRFHLRHLRITLRLQPLALALLSPRLHNALRFAVVDLNRMTPNTKAERGQCLAQFFSGNTQSSCDLGNIHNCAAIIASSYA
jgi:hypothetical protein